MRVETIGQATLYLGDCRQVVPTLDRPAAVLSDPPYGQNINVNVRTRFEPGSGRYRSGARSGRNYVQKGEYPPIVGDHERFDPTWLLTIAPRVVLWGAHKFHQYLPSGQMIVWDKLPNGKIKFQGCGEAGWINREGPMRIFRHLWDGLSIGAGYETKVERKGAAAAKRVHPTQKPVDLMLWCLRLAVEPGGVVLDPYMGAGSTGIACVIAGLPFVGIEIDPTYFDVACRRIEQAQRYRREGAFPAYFGPDATLLPPPCRGAI